MEKSLDISVYYEYTLMGLPWWLSSEESTPTIQETRF